MTSFESEYLSLLMRQVNEEIEYLVRNGHGTDRNYQPCMFCAQHPTQNYWFCNRLKDLRQFQSSIAVQQGRDIPKQRRQIGREITTDTVINTAFDCLNSSSMSLPPLLQPL
ncbi:hypothetical protein [Legionella maceachernii]|uniref:Uncharacterized protein n=1 Tax=Legionella maceachernii TaxID=466 RepID=A0A0W0WBT4_9GAMM|nr:hypothetical protein [Legionella maceachernii]KTD29699.1 hypothetical protein Lmac_0874 [Legionella maceachernii]SKA21331.1 hypothetical protein SAMN02745128_02618 [Legionella maceachernii]SUP02548.1 Uncharacterised protein [Legionella maceachernii]